MMKKLAIFGSILALLTLGAAPVFSAAEGATMGNPKGIAGYTFGVGYFMNYDYLAGMPSSKQDKIFYGDSIQAFEQAFGYGGIALTVHPYAGIGYMGSLAFQFAKDSHFNTGGSTWLASDLNSSFKISAFSGVGTTFPGKFASYSIGIGLHYDYMTQKLDRVFDGLRVRNMQRQDLGIGLMSSLNLFNNRAVGMFIQVNYAYDMLNWLDDDGLTGGGFELAQSQISTRGSFIAVSGGTLEAIVGLSLNPAVILKKAAAAQKPL